MDERSTLFVIVSAALPTMSRTVTMNKNCACDAPKNPEDGPNKTFFTAAYGKSKIY